MEVLNVLLLMAYLIVAAVMVWIVLVQEPKTTGGDLMGGGTTDLFAARGVTGGMYRLTVWLGIIFAALALLIGMVPR